MKSFIKLPAVILLSIAMSPTYAQSSISNPAPPDSSTVPTVPHEILSTVFNPFHTAEFVLSISLLAFGLVVVIIQAILAYKNIISKHQIWKSIIVTLVIVCSMVLITAGYSNNQISGISGILGSIAGYLLAKNSNKENDEN